MSMKETDIRPRELFNRFLELSTRDIQRFFRENVSFVDVRCPACDSTKQRTGMQKLGFTYVLCGDCGSLYVSPRPNVEQLDGFYRDSEAVRFFSTHFYRDTAEARRERIFRPRAELAVHLLDRYGVRSAPVLVDIGSGYGLFMDEVRRLGKFSRVIGVEPNPDLAGDCRARGFEVVQRTVETVPEGTCEANVVTAFEVLEHVFDPRTFLLAARQLLTKDGLLLFTTLTVSGFDIQMLWEHSKSVHPPHHLNLISVEGMEQLMRRSGLELLELETPGELDVSIVSNMLGEDPGLPIPRFVKYMLEKRDERTQSELQQFLRANRLSSHLRVVARA